jgi:predicted anti-sigma-YlaC factor YlaD
MDCDRIREAISAQIDGEDTGLPSGDLEAHLAGCTACREWQRHAHAVTRRARLGGSFLDHDLTPVVLAAHPAAQTRFRLPVARRGMLALLALAQLAIAAPMLFLGHDHDAGVHVAHELGSFNLALAIAFAVGVIRPALSAGLSWPCGMAATGLVATAVADLIGGQAIGADEAQHLVALAGAALLVWQSRANGAGTAGPAIVIGADHDGTWPGTAVVDDAFARHDGRSDYPRGGDAARITAPGIAALATSRPERVTPAMSAQSDAGDHGLAEQRDGRQGARPGPGSEAVA